MALLSACREGDLFKVRQLIKEGCDVNTTGGEYGTTPLMEAAIRGHNQVVEELIRKGARVNVKDNAQRTALYWVSWNGHCSVVKTLCAAGADTNVQDHWGLTPLMGAAERGSDEIVCELIRAGASVNVVTSSEWFGVAAGSTALHYAAAAKNCSVVKRLCAAGADTNVQDVLGATPLMCAAERGRDEIVCELIRAGASVNVVTSSGCWGVAAGSTALHFAAECNHIKCGVLLVEAGADMTVRNKESRSPLGLAQGNFLQSIRQAKSFSTKRIVAVIGNAEHGKSTLIAALQAEGKSIFKRFVNRFAQVQDIRQRTAGIEAVQFSSRKYGQTLFYDFAGQADYHGPHQSFLEAILSKPGVSVTLLLLVKTTDEEDIITQQITRWLQPLALTSVSSTPQVILVGSFLDQVKSKEEAAEKLLRCTQSVQEELPFNIQGPCLLDCRTPESEGIRRICAFFQEAPPLQLNSDTLSYNLHWVIAQVRKAFSAPAITLHTFQSWVLENAELLPRNLPPPEAVCRDLTAVGHTLFLPNKQDPSQSWLIVDLQAILHNVYGTLFSGSQGKVNQFGLLHCHEVARLFPKLDLTMIQEVLISLDFCIQINARILREDLVKLTAGTEGEGWLYFPALVSAQPPEHFPKDADPQHLQWVCWQLRTEEKHLISAHLLQSIILRLAANHVFTHELPSARQHCCSVWTNGLSWMSITGVEVVVQSRDSSVVQVVGRSKAGPDRLSQYVSTIVQDVIKTTTQLSPKLKATSYIVHPYTPAMWADTKAPLDSLYPVLSIIRCISNRGDHVPSLKQVGHLPMSLTELFGGWSPSLLLVQAMDFKTEPQSGECVFPYSIGIEFSSVTSYLQKYTISYRCTCLYTSVPSVHVIAAVVGTI